MGIPWLAQRFGSVEKHEVEFIIFFIILVWNNLSRFKGLSLPSTPQQWQIGQGSIKIKSLCNLTISYSQEYTVTTSSLASFLQLPFLIALCQSTFKKSLSNLHNSDHSAFWPCFKLLSRNSNKHAVFIFSSDRTQMEIRSSEFLKTFPIL